MMMQLSQQRGATLLTSLMILVVLTLLAISAINTSTVNLRIVQNMQAQQQAESAAQGAIERAMSTPNTFNVPAAATATVNNLPVVLAQPVCMRAAPADGYSALWGLAPEDTEWEIVAAVDDSATGARVTIHQGAAVRLASGSCP